MSEVYDCTLDDIAAYEKLQAESSRPATDNRIAQLEQLLAYERSRIKAFEDTANPMLLFLETAERRGWVIQLVPPKGTE